MLVPRSIAFTLALMFSGIARAETTPADAELKVDGITRITCQYGGQTVHVAGGIMTSPKAEYHYDLYLPPGYNDDPKAPFPILFVASPSGKAKLGAMAERVKRDRFIAVMLVESKNGPWDPIVGNFLSAHDDVVKRVRVVDGFKYMTGMSGGARATSLCAGLRPGFAGILLQSAGFWGSYSSVQQNANLAVFATFGRKDMNLSEASSMATGLPFRTPYKYVIFNGGHQWAPKEEVEEGFDWLENWTYFGAPATPAGKPFYLRYFGQLNTEAEAAKTAFARYELLEKAQTFANSHSLAREKSLTEQMASIRSKLADLSKDAGIKKELAARDAFKKASDGEQLIRRKSAGKAEQVKASLAEAGKAYQAIADKYSDTVYGAKANAAVATVEMVPADPEPPKANH